MARSIERESSPWTSREGGFWGTLATLTGYQVLRRRAHQANIRSLQAQLGCTGDEARRIYQLARRDGFGAAYEAVLGSAPTKTAKRIQPLGAPAVGRPRRVSSRRQPSTKLSPPRQA